MNYKAIIFDLDGTLVNTLADIATSMNRSLELHGFPRVAPQEYRSKVGWGIHRLALLTLPPAVREGGDGESIAGVVAKDATRFYTEQPLVYSTPYPGILELVAELKQRRFKTAVLTNKPDPVAHLVIDALFPPGSFTRIQGDRIGLPRKPDPRSTREILQALETSPEETLLVGDSEIDMETAHAVGCYAVGVSWGFRPRSVLEHSGAARIIHRPEELWGLCTGSPDAGQSRVSKD
ncbi:MAG: HAD family hydrolase [Treponema sp.]|jgi:phosphoglycolate phosphatase|nr:HAD family hydrolase [Treponema sp.]